MKRRVSFFAIAAVIAMLVVVLINAVIRSKQATIESLQRGQTQILVAAQALAPGSTIEAGSIRLAPWPRDHIPPGAFTSEANVIGKIARQPIVENQPIVADALISSENVGGVLPLLIPAGMRAMSIPVNEVSDMAGMILPHTRVDVLVTVSSVSDGATPGERSRIVLQNVEVIAANAELGSESNRPREAKVVTLLVSPSDAEKLATALRMGTLHLAMRGYGDQQMVATSGADASQLLGLPAHPVIREAKAPTPAMRRSIPPPIPARTVEIIRNGNERQTINFIAGRPVALPPTPIGATAPAPPSEQPATAPPASGKVATK